MIRVVCLVALAIVSGACTDSTADVADRPNGDRATRSVAESLPERAAEQGRPISAGEVGAVRPDGTIVDLDAFVAAMGTGELDERQVSAVSDGVVAFAEVQALLEHALSCMRSEGLSARAEQGTVDAWSDVPSVAYAYSGEAAGLSDDATFAVEARCATRHLAVAQQVYELQNAPAEEEIENAIADAFKVYRACLSDAGVEGLPAVEESGGNYDVYLQHADTTPECPIP